MKHPRYWLARALRRVGALVSPQQNHTKGDLDVVLDCAGDLRLAGRADRTDISTIAASPASPTPRTAAAWLPGDEPSGSGAGSGWAGLVHRNALSGAARAELLLQVDGTPGALRRGVAGLGIVVRDQSGEVVAWQCARAPALTNNEAEYQGIIAGLELMLARYPGQPVCCLTDSRIAVEQIEGRSAVRAAALQPLHQRATELARQFPQLSFVAIPRELNRLADALAWEALSGRRRISRVQHR
jgi:ribonuclease HI